ncbi:MAG: hypothetical protein AB1898_18490 [Acidobacteriota bacterium]
MRNKLYFLAGLVFGSLITVALFSQLGSVRAVEKDKNNVKVLLENARVRVREVLFEAGVRHGEHKHPYPHVGVILDAGTLGFVEGGKTETVTFKSGQVGWRDAQVKHEVYNAGKTPIRVIEVELK